LLRINYIVAIRVETPITFKIMKYGKVIFYLLAYACIELLNYAVPIINWELILIMIMAKVVADYLNKHLRND